MMNCALMPVVEYPLPVWQPSVRSMASSGNGCESC